MNKMLTNHISKPIIKLKKTYQLLYRFGSLYDTLKEVLVMNTVIRLRSCCGAIFIQKHPNKASGTALKEERRKLDNREQER